MQLAFIASLLALLLSRFPVLLSQLASILSSIGVSATLGACVFMLNFALFVSSNLRQALTNKYNYWIIHFQYSPTKCNRSTLSTIEINCIHKT